MFKHVRQEKILPPNYLGSAYTLATNITCCSNNIKRSAKGNHHFTCHSFGIILSCENIVTNKKNSTKLDQVYCARLIKWVKKREKSSWPNCQLCVTRCWIIKWYWLVLNGNGLVYDATCWYLVVVRIFCQIHNRWHTLAFQSILHQQLPKPGL